MTNNEEASRDTERPNDGVSLQNITIRKATLADIDQLCEMYLALSYESRRLFHPFPFSRMKVRMRFLIMITSGNLINLIKKTIPKLGFYVLVARENNSKINGFTFLAITDSKGGTLTANRGIVTAESTRAKGLGTALDSKLIEIAKKIGISRFSVSALQDNAGSIALHKKMGYKVNGSTVDIWNGREEKAFTLELELS
jgi:L-amino acid N-acyltransferase YncA